MVVDIGIVGGEPEFIIADDGGTDAAEPMDIILAVPDRMERVSLSELHMLMRLRQLGAGDYVMFVTKHGKGKDGGMAFNVQESKFPK